MSNNNVSFTSTSTIAQLKAFATAHGITVTGDKRKKSTWFEAVDAYITHQKANAELLAYVDEQICGDEYFTNEAADRIAYEVGVAEGLIEPEYTEEEVLKLIGFGGSSDDEMPVITLADLEAEEVLEPVALAIIDPIEADEPILNAYRSNVQRSFSSFWEYLAYIVTLVLNEVRPVCYS